MKKNSRNPTHLTTPKQINKTFPGLFSSCSISRDFLDCVAHRGLCCVQSQQAKFPESVSVPFLHLHVRLTLEPCYAWDLNGHSIQPLFTELLPQQIVQWAPISNLERLEPPPIARILSEFVGKSLRARRWLYKKTWLKCEAIKSLISWSRFVGVGVAQRDETSSRREIIFFRGKKMRFHLFFSCRPLAVLN